jgi:Bax protein
MPALRLRAKRRYVPDRSRRVRFARLGLGGCFGSAVVALVVAASQNPDRALLTWPSGGVMIMAAGEPGTIAALQAIAPSAGVIETAPMHDARQIFTRYVEQGYTLERVREDATTVPRVLASSLPRDLPQVESSDMRKAIFIKMLLPLLLAENERILNDRARLLALRARIHSADALHSDEIGWLALLARRYGTSGSDIDGLLRRVDAVPPSLAIAQAALETGWGTSRPAQQGNAMFGQMEMRPGREEPVFAVKTFDDLAAAVGAYTHNLNTHRAYAEFRAERASFRDRGLSADGHELALHIARYSERGMDYVRDVRVIIRTNNLKPLENAKLEG